jgi:hypothetical protein
VSPRDGAGATSTERRSPQKVFGTGERRDFLSFDSLKSQAPYRPQKASLAARGNDVYETPAEAVCALLKVEDLPKCIWEPAAGPGSIVRALRAAGHEVYATDLCDYGCPDSESGIDFLMEYRAPSGVEAIMTNPPYKLGAQFVEHALDLCPRVYMLLPLTFLEGQRRSAALESGSLARVHVFRKRLPRMHRHGWAGPRATSTVAFAWFCWDSRHRGPTELHRISWGGAPHDR